MRGELIRCWLCGTTHAFSARCPTPQEQDDALAQARQEAQRLREVLRGQVLPYLQSGRGDRQVVLREVADSLGIPPEVVA